MSKLLNIKTTLDRTNNSEEISTPEFSLTIAFEPSKELVNKIYKFVKEN